MEGISECNSVWWYLEIESLLELIFGSIGTSCDIMYNWGRPTLPFDTIRPHSHRDYIWLRKIVEQNYKASKGSIINYFVFVTPCLTHEILFSANGLCFLRVTHVLLLPQHRNGDLPRYHSAWGSGSVSSWELWITWHQPPYLRTAVLFFLAFDFPPNLHSL